MTIRLVDKAWGREITAALREDASELRIVCPFIKLGALERLLACKPKKIQIVTRFNLADFADGVSDIEALRKLLDAKAQVRGIKNLHAKLYLFGSSRAIVTSANLTRAALEHNHEFGLIANDKSFTQTCRKYFEDLWKCGKKNLSVRRIDDWDEKIIRFRRTNGQSLQKKDLKDFGEDASIIDPPTIQSSKAISCASQAFVKFLGSSRESDGGSVPLSCPIIEEIERAGCHWAVCSPKKPRQVQEGAVMFIARRVNQYQGTDYKIFGRAIARKYIDGRDDETGKDKKRYWWKKKYCRYIRVYDSLFVRGTMENGVSFSAMMDDLKFNSFASTQRRAAQGEKNINPRTSYMRQPHVELSKEGFDWINCRLEESFEKYGVIPQDEIDKID